MSSWKLRPEIGREIQKLLQQDIHDLIEIRYLKHLRLSPSKREHAGDLSPMSIRQNGEGLKSARLIMVLSSISPLFILWAIRGSKLIPNRYFIAVCCFMAIAPNSFLFLRLWTARQHNETREIIVGKAEDHRDHLLVYLFAMLLPLYTTSLGDWREFSATLVAVCFIVFLFWNLNLHYMNVLFAFLGYRIFTVYPPQDDNPFSGKESFVLVTRRAMIFAGQRIVPFRLSDFVYWELDQ